MKRISILGNKINLVKFRQSLDIIIERIKKQGGGYVCFTNVHVCVLARRNKSYQKVINNSFMTMPDGRPVYALGKFLSKEDIEQVPGPDFLPQLFERDRDNLLRHYFYGGCPDVLENLVNNLRIKYPKAEIVGYHSPPFRELTVDEENERVDAIKESGANLVWVGLGAPKQDIWMANMQDKLQSILLLGVGAAFDFHSGSKKRAPKWVQKSGFEWAHRLIQDPKRLFMRYLVTNTMFIYYFFADRLKKR